MTPTARPVPTDTEPRILSVIHRNDALLVEARFICGHTQEVLFPGAPKRTPRRDLKEWTFGFSGTETCSRCRP